MIKNLEGKSLLEESFELQEVIESQKSQLNQAQRDLINLQSEYANASANLNEKQNNPSATSI